MADDRELKDFDVSGSSAVGVVRVIPNRSASLRAECPGHDREKKRRGGMGPPRLNNNTKLNRYFD